MNRHAHKAHVVYRAGGEVRLMAYAMALALVVISLGAAVLSRVRTVELFPVIDDIEVTASMGGFGQHTIQVKAGELVRLRLTSTDHAGYPDGGGQHQWAVDELRLNVIAPPMGSKEVVFVADQPGIYTFYCDICCGGRERPTMQGTLVVVS